MSNMSYAECVEGNVSLAEWGRTVAKPRLALEGCDLRTVVMDRLVGRHLVYFAQADKYGDSDGE